LQARIASARQELRTHQQGVTDAQAEDAFLRRRFTNQDLYGWMTGRISGIYWQAYRVALDLAVNAQSAYSYELDRNDIFVTRGYWDSTRKGLLAGEGLTLALNQMEASYLGNNSRRLEIEKVISLRQSFSLEFDAFRGKDGVDGNGKSVFTPGTGQLVFKLEKKLFDDDFDGHCCRKIKSVSVTIPAVVGPYQTLNATLTQTSNTVSLKGGGERNDFRANQKVAICRGVEDSGMFTLDFRDERYLPFEGTGAVSTWTLSLLPGNNAKLDYRTISDVILRLQYTALDAAA